MFLPSRNRALLLALSLVALVAASLSLATPTRADVIQIRLKNGDQITGDLVSESDSRLILKTPALGRIRIPKDQIATRGAPLASPPPAPAVANVSPTNSTPASPTPPPHTAATPPQTKTSPPNPTPPQNSPAFPPTASASIRPAPATNAPPIHVAQSLLPALLRPFSTNWHGTLQLGTDLGFGTADRQNFYANFQANHSWKRVRNAAEYHVAYGFVNDVQAANRMDGGWKLDVDLGARRRIYAYNQAMIGYDEVRHISHQLQEGVGLGYKLLAKEPTLLNLELGAQYQAIVYDNAADRRFYSIRLAENLAWTFPNKLRLTQRVAFMPAVDDPTDFRSRLDLGLSYPLLKRITLNLNLIDEYDTSPPRGIDSNELQIQSTVGVLF